MRAIRRAVATGGLLVVGLLAGSLTLASAPASAAYVFSGSLGGPCTGSGGACEPGQIEEPTGVAVNEETEDVYVVDRGANSVKEFNSAGTQIGEFNGAAAGHALASPEGIAIDNSGSSQDPSTGDVYVTDPSQDVVDKFSATGTYESQLTGTEGQFGELHGVAVDPVGTLWVYQLHGGHQEMDAYSDAASNKFLSSSAKPTGYGASQVFAVDSEDNLYLGSSIPAMVVMKTNKAAGILIEALDNETSTGVAVNQFTNEVFVDNVTSIAEFSSTGSLLERFGAGHLAAGNALAVNSGLNTVYAVDGTAHAVAKFEGPQPPLLVRSGGAANLQSEGGATLEGTVNPKGVPVTVCEFEYATAEEYANTKTYSHSVPCSAPHEVSESHPLTGSARIAVSARIAGPPLRPGGMVVHYRLKASDPTVGYGADKTYITGPFTAPVAGGLPASNVSQFAATLNATLETDQATVDYHFEYGTTTAYGSVAPIPNSYTPIAPGALPISQPVSGLRAGTTYHYRLVANGAAGTNVTSPDETFTTLPVPAPTALTGGASGVGVGSATLGGTIDPHGWDTTYLFEYGPSAAYGSNWPTIPVDMGALEGPQPVVVTVPNLLPSTTYHYRLVAINGGGASYGPDMTFTTGEYPAQIIQEPVVLRTLLVPSANVVKQPATHRKKAKRKRKARHSRKRGRGRGKKGAAKK